MENFKNIFGFEKDKIRKNCILAPVISKGLIAKLNITNFSKSNFYSCGYNENITLIHTLMGASFVGDAVLHLADTPCENLILFGSCGLVKKTVSLDIASIVTPYESYAMESFSDLLESKEKEINSSAADNDFLNKFLYCLRKENIPSVKCASFGSLVLEDRHREYLLQEKIQVLDMECSAFLFAAKHTHKKAIGLFYVTDILGDEPLFQPLSNDDKTKIATSRIKATEYLVAFTHYIANN